MSTEYEPKLIVGYFLEEISPEYLGANNSEDMIEILENGGMLYIEEEDWIGFPLDTVLDINLTTATLLQQKAKEFKRVTGVEAKLGSCIFSY